MNLWDLFLVAKLYNDLADYAAQKGITYPNQSYIHFPRDVLYALILWGESGMTTAEAAEKLSKVFK